MEKSKVLETIVPPITGLVDEAYPLIVALSHERPWQWFYSNYIQIVFKNDDQMGYNIRFYKTDHRGIMWDTLNPWINYNIVNVGLLKTLGMDIVDFLVRSIDDGYYVSVYLDRYYIPGIRNYQKSHMTHEAMVVGYDLENGKIQIMEYMQSYLTRFSVTLDEFRQAYENSDPARCDEIHLLKFDSNRHYEFDLVNISEQLKDYLSARNTSERYRINSNPVCSPFVTFGTDVYKIIRQLLDYNQLKYDIRVFNSLWEHKKVMAERVKFIADNGFVDDFMEFYEPCKDIENKAYLLKSQFMKLCATKNPALMKTILSLLDYIEDKECDVLGRMVEMIDAQVEKNKARAKDAWYSEHAFGPGTRSFEPIRADNILIEFDITPLNDVIEGVVGYSGSDVQAIAYSSMTVALTLNDRGRFEAMDGDRFRAVSPVDYSRNKTYHVIIRADFSDRTYGIMIHNGEFLHIIAEKFRFGIYHQNPADLDKVSMIAANMSSFAILNHSISAG